MTRAVTDQQHPAARFAILGPLTLRSVGGEVNLGPLKQRLLLALLLCRANTPVTVDALIDALWDGRPPRTARKNLQVYVSVLRKLLEQAGLADRLSLRPSGYQLQVTEDESDALRFQHLVSVARAAVARGALDSAAGLLRSALDLWQGPPLPELRCSQALSEEAERLQLRYLPAYEDWAEAELRLDRPARVAETVQEMIDRHPERERLRAIHMSALFRLGRQTEALATYDQLRQHLAAEYGLEPSPALAAQYRTILTGRAERTPAAGPAAPPRRPGVHRLPCDIGDFTGREEELDRLLQQLDDRSRPRRLAVLNGAPGVGKTVTAVHAAHRLGGRYPDGRVLIPMRDSQGRARPLRLVLAELCDLFSEAVPGDGARTSSPSSGPGDAEHRRAAAWRAWLEHHAALVVLDDAASEAQVRPLLPAAGAGTVLVTSRGQLTGLPDALRWSLAPLGPDEAVRLLAGIVGADRVDAGPQAAARIVAAVGGLPLALRICGLKLSVLRHVPLQEFAVRLEAGTRVLDELTAGDTAVVPSLARCWRELPATGRSALHRLCALPEAGFTLEQAAGVLGCTPEAASAELEALMEAGVLTPPDHEVTAHAVWYELPRLLRAYGARIP